MLTLKLVTGMLDKMARKNNQGFTLIEMMIVLVIISITVSFAMLSFGDFGGKRRMRVNAEQFVHYVKLAQQQAVLETSTLGIAIDNNQYRLLRFSPLSNKWEPLNKSRLKPRTFSEKVFLDSPAIPHKKNSPDIIVQASGDITPFKIDLSTTQTPMLSVIGNQQGEIVIKSVTS